MGEAISRLRVVIESADAARRQAQSELFRTCGITPQTCGGPRRRLRGCPLVGGRRCALVETADVVIFGLDLDDHHEAAVLDALRRTHPALPVVVEAPTSTARRHARRLQGYTVMPPFGVERLRHLARGETAHPH